MQDEELDHAAVGKMFVTRMLFEWKNGGEEYNGKTGKRDKRPGRWDISVNLCDKLSQYGSSQSMTVSVEHGIGQKLAEVLLPVIIADASQKAQQLADDSKAMLAALGERALKCIENMPEES